MNEAEIIVIYNQALKIFESSLGIEATYSTDLARVGEFVWGNRFKGVFASDDKLPDDGYFIVNVDAREDPGSHWLAICDKIYYDSFGRKISKLTPTIKNRISTDRDIEQGIKEENCGCRCLAFIYCYDTLGADNAKKI